MNKDGGRRRPVVVPTGLDWRMQKSAYTIDVDYGDTHVWVNSLTGAIDLVPASIRNHILAKGHAETAVSPRHIEDAVSVLAERGHLTELDKNAERESAMRAWHALDGVHRQRAKVVICPSIDCSFRCHYCFEADLQKRIDQNTFHGSAHMSVAQADAIFDNLATLTEINGEVAPHITLFGGEPLWARNLTVVEHIVGRARALGYTLGAISNGHDLSQFAHILGDAGIQSVQISLDGPASVHDKMRPLKGGGATFDRIISEVEAVVEIPGLNIEIRMNYDASNMHVAGELHTWLTRRGLLGRRNVSFHANLISMNHAGQGKDYATIKHYADISRLTPAAELDCFTAAMRTQFVKALETGDPLGRRAHFCSATSGMYVFCPDQRIYSCWEGIGEDHSWIGDFDTDGIRWRRPTLKAWHERTAPAMEKCQGCSHLFLCGGGCTVHAVEQGDMTASQCDGIKKKFAHMVRHVMAERDPQAVSARAEERQPDRLYV